MSEVWVRIFWQFVNKPAYQLPTMKDIQSVPKNGYRVVSTFSGCGGSCLGFEMAGYTVQWANEFVEAARASYIPNHPGVIVDPRSIRDVAGQDIKDALSKNGALDWNGGELDVLEGSPRSRPTPNCSLKKRPG